MRAVAMLLLVMSAYSFAQMLPAKKKSAEDSVNLSLDKPLAAVEKSPSLDTRINPEEMRQPEEHYARDVSVYLGAEFLGGVLKDHISPNSKEADAAEIDLKRK